MSHVGAQEEEREIDIDICIQQGCTVFVQATRCWYGEEKGIRDRSCFNPFYVISLPAPLFIVVLWRIQSRIALRGLSCSVCEKFWTCQSCWWCLLFGTVAAPLSGF